jgi:hypothetical protein
LLRCVPKCRQGGRKAVGTGGMARLSASPGKRHQEGQGAPGPHLVFNQQKPLPIATVGPRPTRVVRLTPLGVPCSEPQQYNAPRPGLRMLPFCVFAFPAKAATTYSRPRPPAGPPTSRYSPGVLLPGGASTKLVWGLGTKFTWRIDPH